MPEIARSLRRRTFGFRRASQGADRLRTRPFDQKVEDDVAGVLAGVRARGDAALLEYTERFETDQRLRGLPIWSYLAESSKKARSGLKRGEREALEQAAVRIPQVSRAASCEVGGNSPRAGRHDARTNV